MPYIKQKDRPILQDVIDTLDIFNMGVGDINFLVSSLLKKYIEIHGENYENYNSLVGVLECIKLELYRRKISPYEDVKMRDNGDV